MPNYVLIQINLSGAFPSVYAKLHGRLETLIRANLDPDGLKSHTRYGSESINGRMPDNRISVIISARIFSEYLVENYEHGALYAVNIYWKSSATRGLSRKLTVQQKSCAIDDEDFARFPRELFQRSHESSPDNSGNNAPLLSNLPSSRLLIEWLHIRLQSLSNLRAYDEDGICFEMLKYGSDRLKNEILNWVNMIIGTGEIEELWYHRIFRMLSKGGDLSKVTNWRPIAVLPILYKSFARMIYNHIAPSIFARESRDQHAFIPDIQIEDVLLCAEGLSSIRWNFKLRDIG